MDSPENYAALGFSLQNAGFSLQAMAKPRPCLRLLGRCMVSGEFDPLLEFSGASC
jgi:hypothetical protein